VSLVYKEDKTNTTINFPKTIIDHFTKYRQIERNYETGGQLFARFLDSGSVLVEKVSGPRKKDSKLWNFFRPDVKQEQREIDTFFAQGYHFIGDWHTHPEDRPTPSREDISNIGNIFRMSKHSLAGFLLVIVGRLQMPSGLYVGIHDGIKINQCNLVCVPILRDLKTLHINF